MRALQVISRRDLVRRFQATNSTKLNPLIGREHEIETFCQKWRFACGGAGQVALVSGKAGIGKSRLIEELRLQTATEPGTALQYNALLTMTRVRFYPVFRQLQKAAGLRLDDVDDMKLEKVARVLRDPSDLSLKLVAYLLSIPFKN